MSNLFRNAIFVDAGYVFGQGGVSLTGSSVQRTQLSFVEAEFINQLKSIAVAGNMPLLRIYWYDGARAGMTPEQTVLAEMADVKVRLGSINTAGQQKGVDSLLVTDLIDLARNKAIADAYIVTGDGDMRIAVQIAQGFGVRVHLITLEPSGVSLNPQLRQEVDTTHEIPKTEVAKFLQVKGTASATPITISASAQPLISIETATKQAITSVSSFLDLPDIQRLKLTFRSDPSKGVPKAVDSKILGTCRGLLDRELDDEERRVMRRLIRDWLDQS